MSTKKTGESASKTGTPKTTGQVADAASDAPTIPAPGLLSAIYRLFAYFGLFSIYAALIFGFRHDLPEDRASALASPSVNFAFNIGLYAIFMVPHLVMTRSWFKQAVWRNPAGSPAERRVYISTTVIMWLGVLILHRPVPGLGFDAPPWLFFTGLVLLLISLQMFFDGVTRQAIDGLLGVPGSVSAYSHGSETPLFTEGPYASVRHPMYRAFILAAASSLVMHPNAGQLLWCGLLAATFIGFIPIEESQLMRARGEDYQRYREQTRWRIFPWIW